jgi:hypothetical protein
MWGILLLLACAETCPSLFFAIIGIGRVKQQLIEMSKTMMSHLCGSSLSTSKYVEVIGILVLDRI